MNKKIQILKYVVLDVLAASISWVILFLFRKIYIENFHNLSAGTLFSDTNFIIGFTLIPLIWLLFYVSIGFYKHIYRRSRLKELYSTLFTTLLGTLVLFFVVILDDYVESVRNYYEIFIVLFSVHFTVTYFFRLILSSATNRKVQKRIIGFNTVVVGSNAKALGLVQELNVAKPTNGFFLKGFVNVNGETIPEMREELPQLGNFNELKEIIKREGIEEILIAIESNEHDKINSILRVVENENVFVKILPDLHNILTGMVKMDNIMGAVLLEVNLEIMPPWQKTFKRIFDIAFSLFALVLFSPFFLLFPIVIKLTSKGSIFYLQERIGKKGKPFNIIKFRTMVVGAEANGPQLSKERDSRITSIGWFLRKSRLDEIPQFINVLIGDMSVVSYRPERKFFIDQIVEKAPYYVYLQRIKPGITSWGQVKYGYAENVDEMVERLKYDILYLENMSLGLDFKILAYTVLIMFQGRGK